MSMGRVYAVIVNAVAVSAVQDLFMLAPADDKPIRILACYIGQSTDVGDAQEELFSVQIIRGLATVGSGGGAFTPNPLRPADAAAGMTARINDTTVAVVGAGTTTILHAETFNIRAGWQYVPTPETWIYCSQVETRLVIRLTGVGADAVTINAVALVEELI